MNGIKAFFRKILYKLGVINSVYYINGSEKLPPPLSSEEEAAILKNYDGKNRRTRDLLITHNLRLVVYIAKKFDSPTSNIED